MTFHTAIHYPPRAITQLDFLATALLLWDQVESLAGTQEYQPVMYPGEYIKDADLRRVAYDAQELLFVRRVPTPAEQNAAHQQALALLECELPILWRRLEYASEANLLVHMPDALMLKTCREFERANLMYCEPVTHVDASGRETEKWTYFVSRPVWHLLMGMLATECAGETKRTVTDVASVAHQLEKIGQPPQDAGASLESAAIPIGIPMFDVSKLSLKKLVALRKREAAGDAFLKDLRHRYLEVADSYVTEYAAASTDSDRQELRRLFNQRLHKELTELQRRLDVEGKLALLSKEMLVGVMAGAGVVVEPVAASIVGIGALLRLAVSYKETRRKCMQEKAMSWLYQAGVRT